MLWSCLSHYKLALEILITAWFVVYETYICIDKNQSKIVHLKGSTFLGVSDQAKVISSRPPIGINHRLHNTSYLVGVTHQLVVLLPSGCFMGALLRACALYSFSSAATFSVVEAGVQNFFSQAHHLHKAFALPRNPSSDRT